MCVKRGISAILSRLNKKIYHAPYKSEMLVNAISRVLCLTKIHMWNASYGIGGNL